MGNCKNLVIQMMDWCFENDIEYITELIEYAKNNRVDWHILLSSSDVYTKMVNYLQAPSER